MVLLGALVATVTFGVSSVTATRRAAAHACDDAYAPADGTPFGSWIVSMTREPTPCERERDASISAGLRNRVGAAAALLVALAAGVALLRARSRGGRAAGEAP